MATKDTPGDFDCYAKLRPDEPYFVIRAKDPVGAKAVRAWCQLRRGAGILKPNERQRLREAEAVADAMQEWRKKNPRMRT